MLRLVPCLLLCAVFGAAPAEEAKAPIKVLFLGDNGHHQPADRFRQIKPVLAARGIELTYADKADALNTDNLAKYDGLLIYSNLEKITPEEEKALLDYVNSGKGFIPIHCASFCFLNSPKYVELVGAQFQRHNTGTFRTTIAEPNHPIMKGFGGFESWDETYVHTKHNTKGRTVLEYRVEGNQKEPWTWVRDQGKGRVFYTAWGHDERTWGNPGFQNLLERGIRWAVGGDPGVVPPFHSDNPEMTTLRKDVKPFEYKEAKIPFYIPGAQWGRTGQPITQMQLPLDPRESMKHYLHPADLELELFASEEQIGGKPIAMNWDERGRLWVCVTYDYPNEMQPQGQGRDRIIVLEDTKGTGHADKVTTFADKLSIPTSLTFYKGGVIVNQAPHTLYLKDTRGDGVADERKILFTGWGTQDTHAGPSNLHWGPDNWIWGMCGYSGFNGTVGGEHVRFSQGIFRFKPDGSKLEFVRSTSNNSWGLGFSEEGYVFGSTANGNPSVFMAIPNRSYEAVRGWSATVLPMIARDTKYHPITDKIRQVDWHGSFTAAAGHALYTARTYPREYWNRTAFVSDPTGHLTATFVLDRQGADYRSHYAWNLLAGDDEWNAPIFADVGPDGNVWVIDWYNFIVQHNPTPPGFRTGKGGAYETDLRDKRYGRIYRLLRKDGKKTDALTLEGALPDKLIATLKNDNMFWRMQAQRLLVERGDLDVVPGLVKLAGDQSVDEIGLNPGAIHALWTLQGLGALDGMHAEATAAAVIALRHPSAGVRRNAAQVLPREGASVKALLDSGAPRDADAQVRLAALLALAEMPPDAQAGAAIAVALNRSENLTDRILPDGLTCAAARHDRYFLQALTASKTPLEAKALDIVSLVAEHYARGGPVDSAGALLASLTDADPRLSDMILAGLVKGWPKGKPATLTEDQEKALAKLLPRLSPGARGRVVTLASFWGSKAFDKYATEIAQTLFATVGDAKQSDTQRASSARQLVEFRPEDGELPAKLVAVITPRTSPELAAGIIEALSASNSPAVAQAILARQADLTPAARRAAFRVLLSRPATTAALLDAAEKGQISLSDLALDQQQALAAHPDRRLARRASAILARGGGLPNPDREKVVQEFLSITKTSGDAAQGKLVFEKQCAKCHMHSGQGNKIGPDLTGMAVHTKEHLLVDILDPSRNVEANYRVYVVETKNGRVFQGLLASETKNAVELLDAENKRVTVLRDNIESLNTSPKSLMPEGFEKQFTREELTNLLEFLTQRGKYLPLPLGKAATVITTKGMFYREDADTERLIFSDWGPKTFNGVPFLLVDPQDGRVPNAILLNGPEGKFPPTMPRSVELPCNAPARAIHLLSGVSGWGYPYSDKGSVTMIVRLHYADGTREDHELLNGVHFADYIRVVDVPESKLAFRLRGQQIRYLAIQPKKMEKIDKIEFIKGKDRTAPVVMAVTVETAQ